MPGGHEGRPSDLIAGNSAAQSSNGAVGVSDNHAGGAFRTRVEQEVNPSSVPAIQVSAAGKNKGKGGCLLDPQRGSAALASPLPESTLDWAVPTVHEGGVKVPCAAEDGSEEHSTVSKPHTDFIPDNENHLEEGEQRPRDRINTDPVGGDGKYPALGEASLHNLPIPEPPAAEAPETERRYAPMSLPHVRIGPRAMGDFPAWNGIQKKSAP